MATPLRTFLNHNTHAVTKWTKELNDPSPPGSIRLNSIIASAQAKYNEFCSKRSLCLDASNSEQQDYDDADDLMDKCQDITATAKSLLSSSLSSTSTVSRPSKSTSKVSAALPKIKIDYFAGDISRFDHFWNLFENFVTCFLI